MVYTWALEPKLTGQEVIWEEFGETVNMVCYGWLLLSIEENCQNMEECQSGLWGKKMLTSIIYCWAEFKSYFLKQTHEVLQK